MMTPIQKAKELFEKFLSLIPVAESCSKCSRMSEAHEGARISQAKECATIHLELLIGQLKRIPKFATDNTHEKSISFFEQVKQEIEKL